MKLSYRMFILLLSSHFIINLLSGQCSTHDTPLKLIEDLKRELLLNQQDFISIKDLSRECDVEQEYNIRKEQPNTQRIQAILKQLACTKDFSYMADIQEIYNLQVELFKKEWAPVFDYQVYVCDLAREQYRILMAFETTLHSLYFGSQGLIPKDKYKYHQDYKNLAYHYIVDYENREELVNQFVMFSDYVREMRKTVYLSVNFGYIDPYLEEIETFLIKDFKDFRFENDRKSKAFIKNWYSLNSDKYYYQQIRDENFIQALKEKFDYWYTEDCEAWIFYVANEIKDNSLNIFLLERLIEMPRYQEIEERAKSNLFRLLFEGSTETNLLRDYLLEKVHTNPPSQFRDVILYLGKIHDELVVEELMLFWSNRLSEIGEEECQALYKTLNTFSMYSGFSDEIREAIRELITNQEETK